MKKSYNSLLKKGVISESDYKKHSPVGSKPGILYGCAKVHKPLNGDIPRFQPILSAIGTPTYNLAKFLVPILSIMFNNEYSVKNTFTFVDDLRNQDASGFMVSFDIESLFTNVP